MSEGRGWAVTDEGFGLLQRAVGYLLGSLAQVQRGQLSRPTPCAEWDLGMLLAHLDDSVAALTEAAAHGLVPLRRAPSRGRHAGGAADDPVASLRRGASSLLGSWMDAAGPGPAYVGDCPMSTSVLARAGALELAIHGWDVAQAAGVPTPVPEALAVELLATAALLVTRSDRPGRFSAALDAGPGAPAGVRLLAWVGRSVAQPSDV